MQLTQCLRLHGVLHIINILTMFNLIVLTFYCFVDIPQHVLCYICCGTVQKKKPTNINQTRFSIDVHSISSYIFPGKAFEDQPKVVENHYEPIANIFPSRVTATATATASIIDISGSPTPPPRATSPCKPELPPKPPGLLKMGEPGQSPRRVKSLYNFKGANNDEVGFILLVQLFFSVFF